MRDEGGAFGGEVSGHYYFADFYNADSGTIPALLILELLSQRGRDAVASCSRPAARSYFISGEINSEVADQQAKMDEIAERYGDARDHRARRHLVDYEDWHFNVRPSNTEPLLRLNLESLVSQEDMERRRDEVLALIRVRDAPPTGIHRLPIPTPFMVGRVNCYLIEDDPLTLVDAGPELRQGARRARARRCAEHGHAIEDLERIVITHQHIDHLGLVGDPRPPLGRRGRARSTCSRPSSRTSAATPSATTSSPRR